MRRHVMRVLGLPPLEEEVYRHLLDRPGDTPEDIGRALRADAGAVEGALRRMRDLHLVETDGTGVRAQEPSVAVPRLAERRIGQLLEEIRGLSHARDIAGELEGDRSPDAVTARVVGAAVPDLVVERVTDLAELQGTIDELSLFTRCERLVAEPHEMLTPGYLARTGPLKRRHLRRGAAVRNMVHEKALDNPGAVHHLRELTLAGAEVRVSQALPGPMLIYHRQMALVPVDPDNSSRGALCVRERGLVDTITDYFERLWADAAQFQATDGTSAATGPTEPPGLTDLHRRVLSVMCRASKDEAGARKVGLALRNYRRHIAEVVDLLEADNRVHAALLARDRGWI